MVANRQLVLASTSKYRKELLARLRLPFEVADPQTDETPRFGEAPQALALRLADAKARAVAGRFPGALVIGSDQVASCGGERYGKPGGFEAAMLQLKRLSGRTARFDTAVALHDSREDRIDVRLVPCEVRFRHFDEATIRSYLIAEQPYDCAASAKAEGLGIALIREIQTLDPSALIGLPLIALTEMLERAGMPVLGGGEAT